MKKTDKKKSVTKGKTKSPRKTKSQRSLGKVFVEFARLNKQTVKLADALAEHMKTRDE